ncbi:unnamed protein product [Calicophoron daubneyi]
MDRNSSVCVDTTIYLKQEAETAEQVDNRMCQLLRSTAVVNVFLSSAAVSGKAIEAILRWSAQERNRFLWIGTNFMIGELVTIRAKETREGYGKTNKTIEHLVLVVPAMVGQKLMENYTINLKRDYGDNNWKYDYLKQLCTCIPAESAPKDRQQGEICSKEMEEWCIDQLEFDAMFYAPTVANSVFAVASALKRMQDEGGKQNPRPVSTRKQRIHLLELMKNNPYEGFSGLSYEFYQGFEGSPRFTVVSYHAPLKKWLILAQYNSDVLPQLTFENETVLRYVQETHPQSRCSKPCSPMQATRIDIKNPCCWYCTNCSANQIIVPRQDEIQSFFPDIIPTACEYCEPGTQPNANRSGCVDLPLVYLKPYNPMAICFIVFGVVGLAVCILCATVYALHWKTPVIRASGREVSMVLLASISYAFANCIVICLTGGTQMGCIIASVAPGMYMTICYAAIYTRLSHIDRLFRLSNLRTDAPKKFISLRSQCLVMGSIIAAQAVLVGVSVYFWTPKLTKRLGDPSSVRLFPQENVNGDVLIAPGMPMNQLICFATTSNTLFIGFIIPVVLLLVSMVHAYKIRKVPTGFNEARALGFVNYLNFIHIILIPILGIIVRYGLLELLPECCFLTTSAMTELLILIAPKIYIVVFKPHKNTQIAVMRSINRQSQVESIGLLNEMDEQNNLRSSEATEMSGISHLFSNSLTQDIANNISIIGNRGRSISSPCRSAKSSAPSSWGRMTNVRRHSSTDGGDNNPSTNPPGKKEKSVSFYENKDDGAKLDSTSNNSKNYTFQPGRGELSEPGTLQAREQCLHRGGMSIIPPADLTAADTVYLPPASPRFRQNPYFSP